MVFKLILKMVVFTAPSKSYSVENAFEFIHVFPGVKEGKIAISEFFSDKHFVSSRKATLGLWGEGLAIFFAHLCPF